ncbi:MAG: thioredoxin family protein [Bacteroidetes bacterium]|nr:thioredoxin family protein [Bacteroidota bacterium]
MKKIFTLLLVAFLAITSKAEELVWHTDLMKATELAQKENKSIMLFFTGSDWCGWCKRLQKEVFFMDEFKTWANKNVILVELDFPRTKTLEASITAQNQQLQQMFEVRGYPTCWFVNSTVKEGKINLEKLGSTGYVAGGPEAWIGSANTILKK